MAIDGPTSLTRRAFGRALSGAAAMVGLGEGAGAGELPKASALADPDLRDAALRGMALASHRGDPVQEAATQAAIERMAETDPESAILTRIYQLFDVRPASYWLDNNTPAAEDDLASLHSAIRACSPVAFKYTDLSGNMTTRVVLPLALVHPAQGVKLIAWCEERNDFRQFFVRAMQDLDMRPGNFRQGRLSLLKAFLDKEAVRS